MSTPYGIFSVVEKVSTRLWYPAHLLPSATSVPRTFISSLGARFVVFAGAFTSLQLQPHRFLKRCQLWRRLIQSSYSTCPSRNDETVCLDYSVESHVPEEDDARNVDIRIVSASNASEPSLQAMTRADLGFNRSTKLGRCE